MTHEKKPSSSAWALLREEKFESRKPIWSGRIVRKILTEDEQRARRGDGGQVDERGAEVERPRLGHDRRRERAAAGGASAEGRGQERRREREVEEHDEQRRRADEQERREHGREEEGGLGPPPRPRPHPLPAATASVRVRVLVRHRQRQQQLLLHGRPASAELIMRWWSRARALTRPSGAIELWSGGRRGCAGAPESFKTQGKRMRRGFGQLS